MCGGSVIQHNSEVDEITISLCDSDKSDRPVRPYSLIRIFAGQRVWGVGGGA